MRTLRIVLFALALTSLLAGSTAQADEFGRRGFYVGVNAAYGFDLFQTQLYTALGAPTSQLTYSDSWGVNARVGYRLLSFLAVEAQYEWLDGIDINYQNRLIGTYSPNVLTGNFKLLLPTWRLQPYALAGIGLTSWRLDIAPGIPLPGASDTGFAFRGGAGVDIYLTKNIVLNTEGTAVLNTAQFVLPGTGAATIQSNLYYFSLSAGLTYRF